MASPRSLFLFLLFGQDGLEHIAWLGDMREIYFGRNALGCMRCRCASLAGRMRATLKMRAHLIRFRFFQRTGVGLAFG
jgi:hypothetical protein